MPNRRRRRGGKSASATDSDRTDSDSVSTSCTSDEDTVEFDPNKLWITVEKQRKSFADWTLEYAKYYYPHAGHRTYRVPPVDFNKQTLTEHSGLGFAQLDTPPEEDRKDNRSQADVGSRFEELGRYLEWTKDDEAGGGGGGRGLFIVANAQYENYLSDLKWVKAEGTLPPLPATVVDRGELDLLVLHWRVGILLIQVKAVGLRDRRTLSKQHKVYNPTVEEFYSAVRGKVVKAQIQLKKDEVVLHHVMKDLRLGCAVHKVVALPYVSRDALEPSLKDSDQEGNPDKRITNPIYLCYEDMASPEAMRRWWGNLGLDNCTPLGEKQLQSIVGRYCGLLSVVSVACKSAPRVEVRDVAEATDEVGERFARIVLTDNQRAALDSPAPWVFLHGPPGTGKSVMLVVRARQWLKQNHDVAVLNLDFGRPGNPVGHYIHHSIQRWLDGAALSRPAKKGGEGKGGRKKRAGGNACSSSTDEQASETERLRSHSSTESGSLVNTENSVFRSDSKSDAEKAESKPVPDTPERSSGGALESSSSEADPETSAASALSSGSSEPEGGAASDSMGRVFRVDFDLGNNGEVAETRLPELMKAIESNTRPGVPCHFIIDEFYWKAGLACVVKALRNSFPDGCIWCAELTKKDIPDGFEPIMLDTVLRCPPTVQAMLQQFDWVDKHRELYTVDSTVQGLPTDGFKPKLLEHKTHKATSPLDCSECAQLLLDFFRNDLKVDFGTSQEDLAQESGSACHRTSSKQTHTPCSSQDQERDDPPAKRTTGGKEGMQSMPLPRSKKKKTLALGRRVKLSDIFVVFAYPRRCICRDSNLLLVRENLQNEHHARLDKSVLINSLREAGLPAAFCKPGTDDREMALPPEDKLLFSMTNAVTGLERKVVVYVPCESTRYTYPPQAGDDTQSGDTVPRPAELTSSSNSGMPASKGSSAANGLGDTMESSVTGKSEIILEAEPSSPQIEKKGKPIPLHIDMSTCYIPEEEPNSSLEKNKIENNVGLNPKKGVNTVTTDTAAMTNQREAEAASSQGERFANPDPGTVTANSLPDIAEKAVSVENDKERMSHLDSLVATGLSREDWEVIQDRMVEQNQKGLFYAASRCLSMFALIVP